MALKPGTTKNIPGGFAQSMAEEMEKAFGDELGKTGFSDRHLRMIFAAVSQGVVRHLQQNPDAFKVKVELPGDLGTAVGEVSEIDIE